MNDDKIFTLSQYRDYLLSNSYSEEIASQVVNLKIKHSVLGIISKDDRPASQRKTVVHELISHLNRCHNLDCNF
ncbi:hypothetical protein EBS02_02865 [bacterium]|nr:hypothetical protein [bacterium]